MTLIFYYLIISFIFHNLFNTLFILEIDNLFEIIEHNHINQNT